MNPLYKADEVKVIAQSIKRTLDKYNIDYKISIENYNKCIAVCNEAFKMDEHLYIWIRLLHVNGKYLVDISSINLPLKYRHKGIFTDMYNRLKKCKYTDKIKISSVCTEEMHNWCIKNKLESVGNSTYGYDYISN